MRKQVLLFAGLLAGLSSSVGAQWRQCVGDATFGGMCIAANGEDIYVGTGSGIVRTTDRGVTWGVINPELSSYVIRSLQFHDGYLFAMVGLIEYKSLNGVYGQEGLYRLSPDGAECVRVDRGLPFGSPDNDSVLLSLGVHDSMLMCATARELWQSSDNGKHWSQPPSMYKTFGIYYNKMAPNFVISSDSGDRTLLATAESAPVMSTDYGFSWWPLPMPQRNLRGIPAVLVRDSMVYLGVSEEVGYYIYTAPLADIKTYLATAKSFQWQRWQSPYIIQKFVTNGRSVIALSNRASDEYFNSDRYLLVTSDAGRTWKSVYSSIDLVDITASGEEYYVTGRTGNDPYVARSTDNGLSWNPVSRSCRATTCLAMGLDDLGGLIACTSTGLIRSGDDGSSWAAIGAGLPAPLINTFLQSGSTLFAGSDSGAFRSFDRGLTWTECPSLRHIHVYAFAEVGAKLFAATIDGPNSRGQYSGIVYFSDDRGDTWAKIQSLPTAPMTSFATNGDTLFVAGLGIGPSYSTNGGTTWTNHSALGNVTCLLQTHFGLFAGGAQVRSGGGHAGIWRSADGCQTWTAVDGGRQWSNVNSLATDGKNLFAATQDSGVYISRDTGAHWTQVNLGFDSAFSDKFGTGLKVYALAVKNGTLFAAKEDGIARAPIAEITSRASVPKRGYEPTLHISVYPNPASAATSIGLESPGGAVDIHIVDVLGNTVSVIHSGYLAPGPSSFLWDVRSQPPGCYFCTIRTLDRAERTRIVVVE